MAVTALVGVSVGLQVADTGTLRSFARELLVPGGEGRRAYLGHLVEVVAAHERVVLGPDFRCTYYPDGVGAFIDVTSAASAAHREIDRIYSARGAASAEACTVPQHVDLSDPGSVLVLIEPVSLLHDGNATQQVAARCRKWGTVNVCSDRWDDVAPATVAFFGPLDD